MLSPLWNESTKEYSTANLMFKVKSKSRLAQVSALNPDHQQDICLEVCPASALLYLWFMKSAKSGIRLKSVRASYVNIQVTQEALSVNCN